MSKLFVVSYHEVQIAGFRIFTSFEDALKEYLKRCVQETKSLMEEDDDCVDEEETDENDCSNEDEDDNEEDCDEEDEKEKDAEDSTDEGDYEDVSAVLEIQELQDNEYVTVKEFDFDAFQLLIEDREDVASYIESLEKQLKEGKVPEELIDLFSD